jgi:hypothetical protein
MDIIDRLDLLSSSSLDGGKTAKESTNPTPELISIFRSYNYSRYEAQLDTNRVNGGRGACVLYNGKWMTTSASANEITNSNVNGWKFWKFSDNGRLRLIDELRK